MLEKKIKTQSIFFFLCRKGRNVISKDSSAMCFYYLSAIFVATNAINSRLARIIEWYWRTRFTNEIIK